MKAKTRKVIDERKAVRKDQPKISKDIEKLVASWNKSSDKKEFQKRFRRKKGK